MKVFYWSPFLSNIATVDAVSKSINSIKNYDKEKVSKNDKKEEKPENIVTNVFISMGKVNNFQPKFIPMKKSRSVQFNSKLLDNLESETTLQKDVLNYKAFKNQFLSSSN